MLPHGYVRILEALIIWLCLKAVLSLANFYNYKVVCGFLSSGSVATAEDPAAIATIQSAATFSDQPIKYLFKTEGAGGQVGRSVDLNTHICQVTIFFTGFLPLLRTYRFLHMHIVCDFTFLVPVSVTILVSVLVTHFT